MSDGGSEGLRKISSFEFGRPGNSRAALRPEHQDRRSANIQYWRFFRCLPKISEEICPYRAALQVKPATFSSPDALMPQLGREIDRAGVILIAAAFFSLLIDSNDDMVTFNESDLLCNTDFRCTPSLTPALYATDAAEIVRQAQKGGCDKLAVGAAVALSRDGGTPPVYWWKAIDKAMAEGDITSEEPKIWNWQSCKGPTSKRKVRKSLPLLSASLAESDQQKLN